MNGEADPNYQESAAAQTLCAKLRRISRLIVDINEVESVLQTVAEEATQATGSCRSFLALVNEDTGELSIQAVTGEGWTDERRAQRLRIATTGAPGWRTAHGGSSRRSNRGITGLVAETGQSYVTGDVREDPYYYKFFDDVRSEVAVPMIDDNGITRGVLNLQSTEVGHFVNDHIVFLETVANIAVTRLMIARFEARQSALIELGKDLAAIAERTGR